MLNDVQMDECVQRVVDLYAPIQEEYLKLIGKQIKEIGTLSKTNVHRLQQIQQMRKNTQSIIDDLAKVTDMAASEMETIITEIAQGEQDLYTSLFDDLGKVVVPLAENDSLKHVVAAEVARTNKTLYNLADTYAKTLNTDNPPGYRKLLDTAIRSVNSGMTDYNAAIRNSVKQCADTGIAYIDFDSGYIRRLDSQIRMNVLEGVRTSAIEVNKAVGEEFGADGYEISAHGLCAPDHLPYQGKQYGKKVYDGLIRTLARPFGTLNCKHVAFAILMGISEPTYDQDELDEIAKTSTEEISITLGKNPDGTDNIVTKTRYQWSQAQRNIETEIRRQKDRAVLAGQSGDMSARRQAQLSINNYKGQYKTISDAANLSKRTDLMSKSGYHWVKAEGQLKSAQVGGIIQERSKQPVTKITDAAIARVPKVKIHELTDAQSSFVQSQCKELLDCARTSNDHNEVAFVFKKSLEKLELNFTGTEDVIDFGAALEGKGSDLLVIHNHPRNSSYSNQDITFFNGEKIRTLVIVKNNGGVEIITKTTANFDTESSNIAFDRLVKKYVKTGQNSEYDKAVNIYLTKMQERQMILWLKG